MLTRPWKYFHPTFSNFCLQIQLTVNFQYARVHKFRSGKEKLSLDNKLGRGKNERQGPERIERRRRTAGGAERVTGTVAKHDRRKEVKASKRDWWGPVSNQGLPIQKDWQKHRDQKKTWEGRIMLRANERGGSSSLQTGKELWWQRNRIRQRWAGSRI